MADHFIKKSADDVQKPMQKLLDEIRELEKEYAAAKNDTVNAHSKFIPTVPKNSFYQVKQRILDPLKKKIEELNQYGSIPFKDSVEHVVVGKSATEVASNYASRLVHMELEYPDAEGKAASDLKWRLAEEAVWMAVDLGTLGLGEAPQAIQWYRRIMASKLSNEAAKIAAEEAGKRALKMPWYGKYIQKASDAVDLRKVGKILGSGTEVISDEVFYPLYLKGKGITLEDLKKMDRSERIKLLKSDWVLSNLLSKQRDTDGDGIPEILESGGSFKMSASGYDGFMEQLSSIGVFAGSQAVGSAGVFNWMKDANWRHGANFGLSELGFTAAKGIANKDSAEKILVESGTGALRGTLFMGPYLKYLSGISPKVGAVLSNSKVAAAGANFAALSGVDAVMFAIEWNLKPENRQRMMEEWPKDMSEGERASKAFWHGLSDNIKSAAPMNLWFSKDAQSHFIHQKTLAAGLSQIKEFEKKGSTKPLTDFSKNASDDIDPGSAMLELPVEKALKFAKDAEKRKRKNPGEEGEIDDLDTLSMVLGVPSDQVVSVLEKTRGNRQNNSSLNENRTEIRKLVSKKMVEDYLKDIKEPQNVEHAKTRFNEWLSSMNPNDLQGKNLDAVLDSLDFKNALDWSIANRLGSLIGSPRKADEIPSGFEGLQMVQYLKQIKQSRPKEKTGASSVKFYSALNDSRQLAHELQTKRISPEQAVAIFGPNRVLGAIDLHLGSTDTELKSFANNIKDVEKYTTPLRHANISRVETELKPVINRLIQHPQGIGLIPVRQLLAGASEDVLFLAPTSSQLLQAYAKLNGVSYEGLLEAVRHELPIPESRATAYTLADVLSNMKQKGQP
jgi:hypothetical protein